MRRRAGYCGQIGVVLAAAAMLVAATIAMASPAAARVPEILAFGDSLTAGLGLPARKAFPAQLERRLRVLGVKAHVVDAGVSGDTTADGLARLDWALAEKPQLVILELGANDMLRGIAPRIVRANLDAMIKKIQASGASVLLAGMRASANWGTHYQRRFDRIYPELAKARGVALYPFFLAGVVLDPALNQSDGMHPNARGVAVLAARIAPYVARMIGGKS